MWLWTWWSCASEPEPPAPAPAPAFEPLAWWQSVPPCAQKALEFQSKRPTPADADQARAFLDPTRFVLPTACEVADLEWIRPLASLEELTITGKVGDLRAASSLPRLKKLYLKFPPAPWPEGLALEGLRELRLGEGADLSVLASHRDLEVLGLADPPDLAPLRGMALQRLEVTADQLDLAPLASLTRLQALRLDLSDTPLSLDPLLGLPLRQLELGGKLPDPGPLAQMKTLRVLSLDQTDISTLEPVMGLELEQLHVLQANVPAKQYAAFVKAHPNTLVTEPGE